MNKIPTFAIAGDPNVGKSTIVATLSEIDTVKIGPVAGTTKVAGSTKPELDGRTLLNFIDLPGFEDTADLHDWLQENENTNEDLTDLFLSTHKTTEKFKPEREILRSLKGAAVIFVVDASRPVEQKDRDQANILRKLAENRVAIINLREGDYNSEEDREILDEWQRMLRQNFTVKTFNAHHASFEERIKLLTAFSHIMPEWEHEINIAIEAYNDDWDQRLEVVAGYISTLIKDVMEIKVSSTLSKGDKAAKRLVKTKVEKSVKKVEVEFRKNILQIFKHTQTTWSMDENNILSDDLFSEEVWKLLGLNKKQLVATSIAAGAIVGGGIDLLVGGASFGLGTAIGGSIGLALGVSAASMDNAIHIAIPKTMLKLKIQPDDKWEAQVSPMSNLIWILLDRALIYTQAASTWSHGQQCNSPQDLTSDSKMGTSSRWDKADKKRISEWLGYIRKNDKKEQEVRLEVTEFLFEEVKRAASFA